MPRYIYPPRPKSKIKPDQLPFMEKQASYIWQPKFDGDRCVIALHAGEVSLSNRHGKWHPKNALPIIRQEFLSQKSLPTECYLDGELIKHEDEARLVLFDVLLWEKYLVGIDQMERLSILDSLGGKPHPVLPVFCIGEHLWVVNRGDSDFASTFNAFIGNPLLEGLILRQKDSKLTNWGANEYTVDWQIRCRRSHKNYRF